MSFFPGIHRGCPFSRRVGAGARLSLSRALLAAALMTFVASGEASGAFWGKPNRLIVQPGTIELQGPEIEHGLLVTAVDSDGTTLDVTQQSRFISRQPKIISVS